MARVAAAAACSVQLATPPRHRTPLIRPPARRRRRREHSLSASGLLLLPARSASPLSVATLILSSDGAATARCCSLHSRVGAPLIGLTR